MLDDCLLIIFLICIQVGSLPSNLRIVDLAIGHTASAHDALAFRSTCAYREPEWLFEGTEFCWGDSAYMLSPTCISVHKEPASLQPRNRVFDEQVSKLRIRSEHCMGALKNRFQCLNGLNISIEDADDHIWALEWIKVCVILHNIVVDLGEAAEFYNDEAAADIQMDQNREQDEENDDIIIAGEGGEAKRQRLIEELLRHRQL